MKKVSYIFLLITICLVSAQAQDTIIKTNGDELFGKVWEINSEEVKYTPNSNPTGPKYGILKKDVFIVKYKNGSKDKIFEMVEPIPQAQTIIYAPYPNTNYGYPQQRQPNYNSYPPPEPITPGRIDYFANSFYRGKNVLNQIQLNQLLIESGNKESIQLALKSDRLANDAKGFEVACAPLMAAGFIMGGVGSGILFLADGFSNGRANYRNDYLYQLFNGIRIVGFGIGGVGLGSMFVSIGLNSSAKKNMSNAVTIYNSKYP